MPQTVTPLPNTRRTSSPTPTSQGLEPLTCCLRISPEVFTAPHQIAAGAEISAFRSRISSYSFAVLHCRMGTRMGIVRHLQFCKSRVLTSATRRMKRAKPIETTNEWYQIFLVVTFYICYVRYDTVIRLRPRRSALLRLGHTVGSCSSTVYIRSVSRVPAPYGLSDTRIRIDGSAIQDTFRNLVRS